MLDALIVAALVVISSSVFYAVGRVFGIFPPVRNRWVLLSLPPILLASILALMALL